MSLEGLSGLVNRIIAWADRLQREHGVLGFPYAVVKKYGDDEDGRQAALITYHGFLSIFPLLLLGVAALSRVRGLITQPRPVSAGPLSGLVRRLPRRRVGVNDGDAGAFWVDLAGRDADLEDYRCSRAGTIAIVVQLARQTSQVASYCQDSRHDDRRTSVVAQDGAASLRERWSRRRRGPTGTGGRLPLVSAHGT
jgi:hypothetical protein